MGRINPPFPLDDDSTKECEEETKLLNNVQQRHHSIVLPSPPVQNLEQKVDCSALRKHYATIERLLKMMFCYFADRHGPLFIMSILVNCIVWTACLLYLILNDCSLYWPTKENSCYRLIYALFYIVKYHTITSSTSAIAVMVVWALQALIAHIFLIRWQLSGQLRNIIRQLTIAHDPDVHQIPDRGMRQTIVAFYIAITLAAFINIVAILIHIYGTKAELFYTEEHKVFYFEAFHSLRYIFSFYTFITYGLSVTIFALFTRATKIHFSYLNETITKIGYSTTCSCDELLEAMKTHMKLLGAVRELNKSFEVYAFLMLGTAIPITIFSIFMFALTLFKSWLNVIITVPSLFLCIAQLMVFTLIPADLNTALTKPKQSVLANERLWLPFNEETYHIVAAFLIHANQTDMGITIWGFAVVTKPMILSTLSMVVTCIAFLLEMRNDNEHLH